MSSPFPVKSPSPPPYFYEGAHPPTNLLPPQHPSIPLHWVIKPPQAQGALLPLMPDKVILCYICCWSYGSLHVFFLVGGSVPGSFGSSGWLMLLFFLWGCKPLPLFQSFP